MICQPSEARDLGSKCYGERPLSREAPPTLKLRMQTAQNAKPEI
jgi:hypothetical protein